MSTFRKGLPIFRAREYKSVLIALEIVIVMPVWVLLTLFWLVTPKGGNPFWVNCLGAISIAVSVVIVVAPFIRRVMRLDKKEAE